MDHNSQSFRSIFDKEWQELRDEYPKSHGKPEWQDCLTWYDFVEKYTRTRLSGAAIAFILSPQKDVFIPDWVKDAARESDNYFYKILEDHLNESGKIEE